MCKYLQDIWSYLRLRWWFPREDRRRLWFALRAKNMALTTEQIDAFKAGLAAAKLSRAAKLEEYHTAQDDVATAKASEAAAVATREAAETLADNAFAIYEGADVVHDKVLADFIKLAEDDIADNLGGTGA